MLFFFLCSGCIFVEAVSEAPKVLVLVIASDELPIYLEHQQIWRSYMHLDPDHIESYFLKADPDLSTDYRLEGDVIWIKTAENVVPGIMNKTLGAMLALWPRIEREFDFVLRANLSSFFVFPNLLEFLKDCPKTQFYGSGGATHWYGYSRYVWPEPGEGINYGIVPWAQGSGILLSIDLVKLLIEQIDLLWNCQEAHDDVALGDFLVRMCGCDLYKTDRIDLLSLQDWYLIKDAIPTDAYHFRVKHSNPLQRTFQDVFIYEKLLERFYAKNYK